MIFRAEEGCQSADAVSFERVGLRDASLVHYGDVRAAREHELWIVRDDDLRDAAFAQMANTLRDLLHVEEVEPARRLVVNDERTVGGKRLGDGDALALPARERQGVILGESIEVELAQDIDCLLYTSRCV